jgi:predicted enzyme related to lactoylglutathione lyase
VIVIYYLGSFTGVFVRDMNAALEFYVGKVGLAQGADGEYEPGLPWVDLAPANGGDTFKLIQAGAQFESRVGTNSAICLLTENLQESHETLTQQGVTFDWGPVSVPWGGSEAQFADVDGNRILLVQPSEQSRDQPYKRP